MKTLNRGEAIEALKAGKKLAPVDATLPDAGYIEWCGNPFYPVTASYDGDTYSYMFFRQHDTWVVYEPEPELMSLIDAYEAAKPGQHLRRKYKDWFVKRPHGAVVELVRRQDDGRYYGGLSLDEIQVKDWYVTDPPKGDKS